MQHRQAEVDKIKASEKNEFNQAFWKEVYRGQEIKIKELERQLAEAREELRDFAKEYSFEEQLKEKGDE